ncbi:hypothetical protein TcWFU_007696 [Taenia crassiceps]|uniref:AIMP2 thioredoxin-like domain-containing protein n=1 Tax=Taenia crassiceps TaxID=6207 RepID=A0ABR4QU49_9CEST
MGHQQGNNSRRFYRRAGKQTFRAVPRTEMDLEEHIIRKMSPIRRTGKYHSRQKREGVSDQDLNFLHRLEEIERVLDRHQFPMGLGRTRGRVSSPLFTNTKVLKPTTQPADYNKNPIFALLSPFVASMLSSRSLPFMSYVTDDDPKLAHCLMGLERILDALHGTVGPVSSSEHIPSSQPTDSKVMELTTQRVKDVEEPPITPIPIPVTSLESPCAPSFMSCIGDDAKMDHGLKELERILDALHGTVGPVSSSEHIPSSQPTDSKVMELTTQRVKDVEEPPITPIPIPVTSLESPCAPSFMSCIGDDAKMDHGLKELERILDALHGTVGPVSSSEHIPSSQPTDSKVMELTTQRVKDVEEPPITPIPIPVTSLESPCAPSFMSCIGDDAKMDHGLKELDEVLGGLPVPMGLVKSGEHIPFSELVDSKVLEPAAQLAKHIERQTVLTSPYASPSMSHIDDDAKMVHSFKGLDQVLEDFLCPTGLVSCNEHFPPSQLIDSKVLERHAEQTKNVEEPVTTLVSGPITNSVSFVSPPFVDLAIHCDPKTPPFAILLYIKMLKFGGHNISLQFYKHSTLTSIPEHLPQLERFFADQPRSSVCESIISVIWQPRVPGCIAISNPFTDLPLYGESAILMSMLSLSPDFAQIFQNLCSIDSAVLTKNAGMLVDCIKKFGKSGTEPFSIEELLLFISCEVAGLSPLVQGASKSWFNRCMSNEFFATTKKMIDQYR